MKRHVAVFAFLGLAAAAAWAFQGSPSVTTVDPDTGKPGDTVSAKGVNLAKAHVAEIYLTDGKNDDVNGISLASLLRTLKQEADPDKPVMVVFIGFGPDVDMSAMQKIAVQTNGEAYHAMKPQDVQRILIETIARRICEPQCR